jgi:hypothetical protein
LQGWGGHMEGIRTRGHWTLEQQQWNINILELSAVESVLLSLVREVKDNTILLRIDSTMAISYINKFGGCRSPHLHAIAKRIFKWAEMQNVWLVASYISSKANIIADYESRVEIDETDWMLDRERFNSICNQLEFFPKVDLFATHLSIQCHIFSS